MTVVHAPGRDAGALDLERSADEIRLVDELSIYRRDNGRRLRRYERRRIVERVFAWMQWHCRLLVRWEYYPANFLGFIQLGAICIMLKRF